MVEPNLTIEYEELWPKRLNVSKTRTPIDNRCIAAIVAVIRCYCFTLLSNLRRWSNPDCRIFLYIVWLTCISVSTNQELNLSSRWKKIISAFVPLTSFFVCLAKHAMRCWDIGLIKRWSLPTLFHRQTILDECVIQR